MGVSLIGYMKHAFFIIYIFSFVLRITELLPREYCGLTGLTEPWMNNLLEGMTRELLFLLIEKYLFCVSIK